MGFYIDAYYIEARGGYPWHQEFTTCRSRIVHDDVTQLPEGNLSLVKFAANFILFDDKLNATKATPIPPFIDFVVLNRSRYVYFSLFRKIFNHWSRTSDGKKKKRKKERTLEREVRGVVRNESSFSKFRLHSTTPGSHNPLPPPRVSRL